MSNMDVYLHEDPKAADVDDIVNHRLSNTLLLANAEQYENLKERLNQLQVPKADQGVIVGRKGPYVIVKFEKQEE